MNHRLLVGSIAAAVVIAVGGGWALASSTSDDGNASDDVVTMDEPGVYQDPTVGTNAPVQGDPLPDVTLEDTDGNEVVLSSFVGAPLVINFWYSDCPPCEKEMPELGAASTALDGKVTFVGVNTLDDADRAASFAVEHGAGYLQLLDPDGELLTSAGVGIQPTTLFVSADGTIVKQQAGELTAESLDAAINEAFPEVA